MTPHELKDNRWIIKRLANFHMEKCVFRISLRNNPEKQLTIIQNRLNLLTRLAQELVQRNADSSTLIAIACQIAETQKLLEESHHAQLRTHPTTS